MFTAKLAPKAKPKLVLGRQGDDVTIAGIANDWISRDDGWWWRGSPNPKRYAVHIHTDRPIYRPGQTVSFKAIVRRDDDAELSLPELNTPVTVRIRDGRKNAVQTIGLRTNEFGTVHGRFDLAEGAMLGEYNVEVNIADEAGAEKHKQRFKVESYAKPDFEVNVVAEESDYVAGQPITVSVEARYLYGRPVPNAKLTLREYDLWRTYRWDDEGAWSNTDEFTWAITNDAVTTGTTDAQGKFTFTLPAKKGQWADWRDQDWQSSTLKTKRGIEVTASDGSEQFVSGMAVINVFNAAERIKADLGSYEKKPGQTFVARAEVTTLDGKPVANRELRLNMQQWDNGYSAVQTATVVTDANGQANVPIGLKRAGFYQVVISGKDGLGNDVSYSTWLYAFDKSLPWHGGSSPLSVRADKPSYAPGDLAQLQIESAFSGPALITFERARVRPTQLVQLTKPLTQITVPILPGDAPNIFLKVNAWEAQDTTLTDNVYTNLSDSRLHQGSAELVVPIVNKALNVTLTPNATMYSPRQRAAFTINVADERGRPVEAEVSLALVDEAIFKLSDDLSGPLFDAFYSRRTNAVRTYDSMAPMRFGGGGGGGGGFSPANPRGNFPDTALWLPELRTGKDGRAVVSADLPDSLTRWRLTARAVTQDTRVGEATASVTTQQPVVVRPVLPHRLIVGDSAIISAIVRNDSTSALDFTVTLLATQNISVTNSVSKTVNVPAGGERTVDWPVKAAQEGEIALVIAAVADGDASLRDAVAMTVPVRSLAVADVRTQSGSLTSTLAGTNAISFTFAPPADALSATTTIEINRSTDAALFDGLEYLTGFPYGCVEQTMSRALPNAVVGRALKALGVSLPEFQGELPAQINASVQRLYGFQHDDGGWGWWFDDNSDGYNTTWVLFGLSVMREAGYEIDPDVIARGADWLKNRLDQMEPRTQAFAVYALAMAGKADADVQRQIEASASRRDAFSVAAYALALHKLGEEKRARALLVDLMEMSRIADGMLFWTSDEETKVHSRRSMASPIQATAFALSAFAQIRPDEAMSATRERIANWLMAQRTSHGWGHTNETSFAILALTDQLLVREAEGGEVGFTLRLNDQIIRDGELTPTQPTLRLELPMQQLRAGSNTVTLEKHGEGVLFYRLISRATVQHSKLEASGAISVSREYLVGGKPVAQVTAGQLVEVRLKIFVPAATAYVLIEDKLPGGLQALNERLNTTSRATNGYASPYAFEPPRYGYNNKEVRDDRVNLFVTEWGVGTREFSYWARATRTGTFVVLPAEAWAMYDETLWGRSSSEEFIVSDR